MLGFDFEIQYRPGLENKAADALSRRVGVLELMALSVPKAIQLEDITSEVDRDQRLSEIREEVLNGSTEHSDYTVTQGRLLRQGKLVLPADSPLREVIMKEFHSGKVGGHGGVLRTQKRIGELFYWKGMMTEI